MTSLEDFGRRVLPYAIGCSDMMAEMAARDAAIDFCRRSYVLQETTSVAVDIGDAVPDFTLSSSDLMPFWLMGARWDGKELEQSTEDDLTRLYAGWRTSEGKPKFVVGFRAGSTACRVVPMPVDAGTLELDLALTPTRSANELPDTLMNDWADAVTFGALSRVLRLPNQPFTDIKTAAFYSGLLEEEIRKARSEVMANQSRAELSVVRFAFGSR